MRRAAHLRRWAAAGLLAATLGVAAPSVHAEQVIMELSPDVIDITSNFTGEAIAVFGVVVRDRQTVSRPGGYDLVITVAGPLQEVQVQRKRRIAGIWINAESHLFTEVPSLYVVYTSRPLAEFAQSPDAREHGLGLAYVGHGGEIRGTRGRREPFREALVALKSEAGLYSEAVGGVEFVTDAFFKASVQLPAAIPAGRYRVSAYLFSLETMLAMTETSFVVQKVDFEQAIFDFAQLRPASYGIAVVVLALLIGYLGDIIFRRR